MFPRSVIDWHVLKIAKAHFRYTIWLMISEKSITKCMILRGAFVAPTYSKQSTKKNVHQKFYFFRYWNCLYVNYSVLKTWALIYLRKAGISKHSEKKIMQFLWTVVTCLLKNVEHGIEHVLDSANGVFMH